MQTYNVINNELTGAELPGKIYENLQSLKSEFSGTSFPTENLVAGMTCYRTDEGKVYRLMPDLNTWEIENNFSGLWEDNEQVKVGDVRYLSDRKYAGYVLECIQAGTTGNAEPVVSDSDVDNATDLEGFSGTLQIAHGGTGATSVAEARNALGLGNTNGALPVDNGGTGATTAEGARSNLGLTYATQDEAEAGTNNTTVMTPLRTKNAIDKQRPLKTFTSLEQLGLDNNATIEQICETMPSNSSLLLDMIASVYPNITPPWSGVDGQLVITCNEASRTTMSFSITSGNFHPIYTASYASWANPKFSGWDKVAYNGALSMPSGNVIWLSNENQMYIAPADGWVGVQVMQSGGYIAGGLRNIDAGFWQYMGAAQNIVEWETFVPASKGQTIEVRITSGTIASVHFTYAQSEV